MGRIVQVLVDNDGKASTGVARTNNEGAPVAGIDQVLAYSYNVKGEVTEMKRDNNVDGKYDYREAYTLDANGRQVKKEIDLTNDGQFDRKEVYTREADDGLVQTDFYNLIAEGGSTREVLTKIEYYELNANNQRTKLSVDTLGDRSINSITRYELDSLGRIAKSYFDTDGDSSVDRIEVYTRDNNGEYLRKETSNLTNNSNSVVTYQRDASGRAIVEQVDNNGDGIIDSHYEYTLDEYGNRVNTTLYTYNFLTGELELVNSTERVFNELNRTVTATYKYPNSRQDYTVNYEYDDFGNNVVEIARGGRNYHYVRTFDDSNTMILLRDYNTSGEPLGYSRYTSYYEDGRGIKISERYYADDTLRDSHYYARTGNGDLIYGLTDDVTINGIGSWDIFSFGHWNATTGGRNISHNFTEWTEEQLAELGSSLTRIRLGNEGITELTLNAEVVAQISEGGLQVRGAADKNDILNLSGFEKATRSDVRGYDLYTASFEGEDLKLYVQANDSITTNIIG